MARLATCMNPRHAQDCTRHLTGRVWSPTIEKEQCKQSCWQGLLPDHPLQGQELPLAGVRHLLTIFRNTALCLPPASTCQHSQPLHELERHLLSSEYLCPPSHIHILAPNAKGDIDMEFLCQLSLRGVPAFLKSHEHSVKKTARRC